MVSTELHLGRGSALQTHIDGICLVEVAPELATDAAAQLLQRVLRRRQRRKAHDAAVGAGLVLQLQTELGRCHRLICTRGTAVLSGVTSQAGGTHGMNLGMQDMTVSACKTKSLTEKLPSQADSRPKKSKPRATSSSLTGYPLASRSSCPSCSPLSASAASDSSLRPAPVSC